MTDLEPRYLFVYGTLMSGESNNRMLPEGAIFVGTGRVPGRLVSLGVFPGLVPGNGTVKGELYAVGDFERTDYLEGYRADRPVEHNRYVRRPVRVAMDDGGRDIDAQAYYYNRPTAGRALTFVESGDWRTRTRLESNR